MSYTDIRTQKKEREQKLRKGHDKYCTQIVNSSGLRIIKKGGLN